MSPAYEFDDVRVDPVAFRATKAGRPVSLEPKAFEVLVFLLENPGRLVEKRELLEKVWPDTVVTESAMTRVIADLRHALGDAAHEARYIETVPTKGYRFIAEVRRVDGAPAASTPAPHPVTAPRGRLNPALVVAGATALGLLVFVAVFLALRAPRSRPTGATAPGLERLTQVTDSLGVDAFPSFSPDGAQVAYCSDRDGPFEIYVRQLAPGGRGIRITSDGRDNQQPAWSPDGTRIAYTSRAMPGIWIVPALGGEPRRLTTFGSRPAWSPDAATIAFQSEPLQVMYAARPATTSPSSLWLVPAAGGDPVPLTHPGTPTGGHGSPVFSPDGNDVVFATTSELWSVARKGGAVRRILPREEEENAGALRHVYYDPAFSPKGDLYFAHTDQSGRNSSLWRARAPAGPGRSWGAPERVTPDATAWVRHIAVSRAGRVAYAGLSATSNLWSLPLDPRTSLPSGAAAPLTRVASPRATAPRFSPDGRRIAFVLWGTGGSLNVCVVDAKGGDARPVTLGAGFGPEWLPDGKRIAFNAMRDGTRGIWAVTLEGLTEKLLLPTRPDMLWARLSPDRKHFAFHRESPERELSTWVAPLDGGPERRVTPPELSAGYPCWSPDGRTLAVEILRPPDQFLGTIPAGGGPLTALVEEKGLTYPWDFSPDGERISFAGERDGVWNVYWVSRKDRSVQRLTDNTVRRTFLRYPAWSPRGDRIVYEYVETTGNIWLLEPAK